MASPQDSSSSKCGPHTPEHSRVQGIYSKIVTALSTTPGAVAKLTSKFKDRKWIGSGVKNLTAEELVDCALGRIFQDVDQYHAFVDILSDIPGMDIVQSSLIGTL